MLDAVTALRPEISVRGVARKAECICKGDPQRQQRDRVPVGCGTFLQVFCDLPPRDPRDDQPCCLESDKNKSQFGHVILT